MQSSSGQQDQQAPASSTSLLRQKADSFRKEIRSGKLSRQFASRRKMLFREQMAQLVTNQNKQFIQLNSWDQVKQQLHSTFIPNYQGINKYIQINSNQKLPQDVQQLIVNAVQRPEFLTNEQALVLLVTVTNIKKNDQLILDSGVIKLIVDGLIRWNLVSVQQNGRQQWKLHYFETLCWTLLSLVIICDSDFDETFHTLKEHINVFQTQTSELPLQLVALLSQLSTNPNFFPSLSYIHYVIQKASQLQTSNKTELMPSLVHLLDNYIRYNSQNPHRFKQEENVDLAMLYIRFIRQKTQDMKFPSSQKIQLVNLLTTLIKSSSDELLRSMFNTEGSGKLCELIFYRAQYDEWGGKKASLICLCEMVCNELLLPVINRIISPSAVAHICWNSLLLPDMEIQTNIVCTIYLLCQVMPQVYEKEFRKYSFSSVIKTYEFAEGNYGESRENALRLSEMMQIIEETHIKNRCSDDGGYKQPEI